jgi:hypothetical protein
MGMAQAVSNFLLLFRDMGTASALVQRRTVDEPLLASVFWLNKTQLKQQVRKWGESTKGMPGQLAVMKRWMDEADGMELESKWWRIDRAIRGKAAGVPYPVTQCQANREQCLQEHLDWFTRHLQ